MRVLLTVVGYFTSNLIVLKSLQSGRVIYDVRCKYRNRIILVQLDKPNRPLYNNTSYYFYSWFYPSQVLRISLIRLRFTHPLIVRLVRLPHSDNQGRITTLYTRLFSSRLSKVYPRCPCQCWLSSRKSAIESTLPFFETTMTTMDLNSLPRPISVPL